LAHLINYFYQEDIMVRHIVMWNFKEEFTEEENIKNAQKIKTELEALTSKIEGVISLKVMISTLPSGNRAVVLNSLFTDEDALKNYIVHPEHVRVGTIVRAALTDRVCADYIE